MTPKNVMISEYVLSGVETSLDVVSNLHAEMHVVSALY